MTKEDYFKYYIQGTDHYLIPKDVFNELFNEISNWREEAKELKKQLEESDFKIANLTMDKIELKKQLKEERNKVREYSYKLSNFRCEETYENQQKEFIEWLSYRIDYGTESISYRDSFREVLQKFKEIIGEIDGN